MVRLFSRTFFSLIYGRYVNLRSDSIEELLWKAIELKIPVRHYSVDGFNRFSPKACLEKRGVPERVAAQDKERKKHTSELTVVRLDCDWGSSGLWNERGQMIPYDYIDLPLPLVRRIIDWHEEFDATLDEGISDEMPNHEKCRRLYFKAGTKFMLKYAGKGGHLIFSLFCLDKHRNFRVTLRRCKTPLFPLQI